jgi:membrane protein CcdC involved in cytochrome C biogenesis
MKEIIPIAQGSAAVTFPAWSPFLSSGWDVLIAAMGMIVLILTIYNKTLEIKQRRKEMRDDKKG